MSIKLGNTRDVALNGVKMLVYGESGAGKTTLIKTLPNPIVLSAESGLLSLKDCDIPYITVTSLEDMEEAFMYLTTDSEGMKFKSVALDSISEIGERILANEMKINKDGRKAYGEMKNKLFEMIIGFRDNLPGRHVYFSAKMEKIADNDGKLLFSASAPGAKAAQGLPYYFDEVFALRVEKNQEGKVMRMLQTQPDGLWSAKDRSGDLAPWEDVDLGAIINKIEGDTSNAKKEV